jgi:hypothetical protein
MAYSEIFTIFLHNNFFDLEEIFFENFNIFENNIISVELAKVLRYQPLLPLYLFSLSTFYRQLLALDAFLHKFHIFFSKQKIGQVTKDQTI